MIEGAALDKYSFTRDAYLQKRRAEIIEGKGTDGEVPRPDGEPAPAPARDPARQAPADSQRAPAR